MAKILLGVSILLTLLTGILGYLTKGKVDDLRDNLKTAKQTATTANANAAKAQSELKKVQDELTASNATLADREKEIARQKGEMDEISKKMTTANAAVEEKTKQLADFQKQIEGLPKTPGETPEETATKVQRCRSCWVAR
jgi:peptidoglycan hydrolase CwlO-like protein